jgi:aspartyl/asparaginyl beta-hydroxylase (cupin superfamily)
MLLHSRNITFANPWKRHDMQPAAETRVQDVNLIAMRLLAARRFAEARQLLEDRLSIDGHDLSLWLNYAVTLRAMGDGTGALKALEGALRVDSRCFLALLMRASIFDQQGDTRQAAQAYGVALSQYRPENVRDEPTRRAVARAQQVHDTYQREMEAALRRSVADNADGAADLRRINGLIDQMLGRRKIYHQQPTHFYLPGLPAIEFFDREEFPWLPMLESATRDIQLEMAAVMADQSLDGAFQPYIHYPDWMPLDQWRPLNNSRDWTAFHLLEKGRPVPGNADRCPRTMEILAQMPQPVVPNRSPAGMFSVLKPRTKIPPHTGVANTRLVVHLPLLVPPGCGFRVGNETREWKVGEAWVFDDTIEHEAWNDSDETRVVLIFDIWHPRLTEAERQAYAKVMAAIDAYSGKGGEGGI